MNPGPADEHSSDAEVITIVGDPADDGVERSMLSDRGRNTCGRGRRIDHIRDPTVLNYLRPAKKAERAHGILSAGDDFSHPSATARDASRCGRTETNVGLRGRATDRAGTNGTGRIEDVEARRSSSEAIQHGRRSTGLPQHPGRLDDGKRAQPELVGGDLADGGSELSEVFTEDPGAGHVGGTRALRTRRRRPSGSHRRRSVRRAGASGLSPDHGRSRHHAYRLHTTQQRPLWQANDAKRFV